MELKSVQDEAYLPSTGRCLLLLIRCLLLYVHTTVFSAVLKHASSHTNVAPRALTNVRGRTAVLAGMTIDFFCFQSGLVVEGMIDNSGTRHARSCLIAARECPRAGSKQMATHQAVAQTQSSWSSSCERTSPRCGRKQVAAYQAVAQTQSSCLIAARERPRAGSKQMATYQAVVAQTQSSSSSSNVCCSVATQTWSAHVARSLPHAISTVHHQ